MHAVRMMLSRGRPKNNCDIILRWLRVMCVYMYNPTINNGHVKSDFHPINHSMFMYSWGDEMDGNRVQFGRCLVISNHGSNTCRRIQ